MNPFTADQLLNKHNILSDQVSKGELYIILTELRRAMDQNPRGSVVEFGCYTGTASLFIQRLLQPENAFHVYDSFAGLPEKTAQDTSPVGEQFKPGELSATKDQFIQNFKKAGLPLPTIHKGWFQDLTPQDVPNNIMFAFLDGDYYESIRVSLRHIEAKLALGAVIIVDDYANEALPGAATALNEWLANRNCKLRTQASLAIVYT